MTLLIAWRNLFHDRIRFAITIVGITISTVLIGVQLGMLLAFLHTVSTIVDNAGADLWITARGVPSVDLATPLEERRRFQALSVPGVASAESYMLHFAYLKRADGVRQIVIAVGTKPDAEMGKPFFLVEGASAEEALTAIDGVLIDRLYANKLGIKALGETFEIEDHRFRVVGFTEGVRTFTQAPYVFMSLANSRTLFAPPDNELAYVLIRVAKGYSHKEVAAALAERMPDVEVMTSAQFAARSQKYWLVTTGAGITLISSTLLAVFVGVVIVAQTLYASTTDRLPEYAVIRAMGGPRSYLYKIVVQQSLLGGMIGAVIGLAIIGVVAATTQRLAARPEAPPWLVMTIVATTIIMCLAASISSLRKVMKIDPVKEFR